MPLPGDNAPVPAVIALSPLARVGPEALFTSARLPIAPRSRAFRSAVLGTAKYAFARIVEAAPSSEAMLPYRCDVCYAASAHAASQPQDVGGQRRTASVLA